MSFSAEYVVSKLKLPGATSGSVIPESRQRRDIRNLEKAIIFWIPDLVRYDDQHYFEPQNISSPLPPGF